MSPNSSSQRLRQWGVRLSLVVACLATVATSQSESPPVFARLTGQAFNLSAGSPRATRPLTVRASARKRPDKNVSIELSADVTARWTPADPANTVVPGLRARMRQGTSTGSDYESFTSDPSSQLLRASPQVWNNVADCNLESGCELEGALELELVFAGAPVEGTLSVEWEAEAIANVLNTDELPEGFSLTLTEP